jgi:hypothetical protein
MNGKYNRLNYKIIAIDINNNLLIIMLLRRTDK